MQSTPEKKTAPLSHSPGPRSTTPPLSSRPAPAPPRPRPRQTSTESLQGSTPDTGGDGDGPSTSGRADPGASEGRQKAHSGRWSIAGASVTVRAPLAELVAELAAVADTNARAARAALYGIGALLESADEVPPVFVTRALGHVVSAMQTHARHDADLANAACVAVQNIATLGAGGKESVLASGALTCVVEALMAHPRHLGVARHACGAIWNADPPADTPLPHGALLAVLRVLATHQHHDSAVAHYACAAVESFVRADEVVPSSLLPRVSAALKSHGKSNVDVARNGLAALRAALGTHKVTRDAIVHSRILARTAEAMAAHANDPMVVKNGLFVVAAIAESGAAHHGPMKTRAVR